MVNLNCPYSVGGNTGKFVFQFVLLMSYISIHMCVCIVVGNCILKHN